MKITNKFLSSLISSSLSIVPIILIVLVLNWTGIASLVDTTQYIYFSPEWLNFSWLDTGLLLVGGVILIVGLSLFSIGCDRSLTLVGRHIGNSISKQKNIWIIFLICFVLGALVTCAEPSIAILASQTPINEIVFILVISLGIGIFTALGVIRVIKHKSLNVWLLGFYGLSFALILLIDSKSCVPLIFDSGGATTGTATVPFLLALGAAVASVRGGNKSNEDTFGLIAIASVGPILSLIIMFIFTRGGLGSYTFELPGEFLRDSKMFRYFIKNLFFHDGEMGLFLEVAVSVSPLLILFLIYQAIFIKLPKQEILKIVVGFIYVYFGLIIFLDGVNTAMMPIGQQIGLSLGLRDNWVIILVAFIIGMVSILCEPSIHVLTKQIRDISSGSISSFTVLLTLSLGVGAAIALCAVRSIYNFSMLYYLVPMYVLALALTFICPKLYTAMAFDSGGVASGPMTSSFVLPLVCGIVFTLTGSSETIMERGFGVVGMVATTPILAIQILGIISLAKQKSKSRVFKKTIFATDDAQVIHF